MVKYSYDVSEEGINKNKFYPIAILPSNNYVTQGKLINKSFKSCASQGYNFDRFQINIGLARPNGAFLPLNIAEIKCNSIRKFSILCI